MERICVEVYVLPLRTSFPDFTTLLSSHLTVSDIVFNVSCTEQIGNERISLSKFQGETANSYFGSALFIVHNTLESDRLFDMSGPLIKYLMIDSCGT